MGPTTDATEPDLHSQVRSGLGWSLLNSASGRMLNVALGIALARILAPESFGLFAVATLVLTALQSMNELGVSVAVVRWPGELGDVGRTATTLAMASSAFWYGLAFALAPVLASSFHAPDAVFIIRLLSVGVLLDGFSSIPNALLTRSFRQGRRAIADLVAFIPSAALSIGLTAAGYGAMGLAWGFLAGIFTSSVLVFSLAPQRPVPGWNSEHARRLLRDGIPLAMTSMVQLAVFNVDYIVVGRVLGTTALGYYVLAFNLSSWPSSLMSMSMRRIALPTFAKVAPDEARLHRTFVAGLLLVVSVVTLIALCLSVLGRPLIDLLYGAKWDRSVEVLRWLVILGAARVILDLMYDYLVALGRAGTLLIAQLSWLVALIITLPIAAHLGGIRGVGIGHVLVVSVVVLPLHLVALRSAGVPLRRLSVAVTAPAIATCVTAVVLVATLHAQLAPIWQLVVSGGSATLVYVACMAASPSARSALAEWSRPAPVDLTAPGRSALSPVAEHS